MKKLFAKLCAVVVAACGLSAFGATAPTPLVVWSGDFNITSKTDTRGATWTFDKTLCTVPADGMSFTVTTTNAEFKTTSAFADFPTTVIIKYSAFSTSSSYQTLISLTGVNGNYTDDANTKDLIGLASTPASGLTGMWMGVLYTSGGNVNTYTLPTTGGTVALRRDNTVGVQGYVNAQKDNDQSAIKASSFKVNQVNIGGQVYHKTGSVTVPVVANGLTVTGVAIFNTSLDADAIAAYEFPRAATISASANVSDLITPAGTTDVRLYTSENSTLTLDANVTGGTITLDVADGKTLTIDTVTDYDYDIEATTALKLTGKGSVKLAKASVFGSKVTGDGVLLFDGALPTTKPEGLQDSTWTGTVWLKGFTWNDFDFDAYGHTGSKVKLTGIVGYSKNNTTDGCNPEIILEDSNLAALEVNNGYGGSKYTFAKVSGTGTLKLSGAQNTNSRYVITDASDFAGTLTVASNTNKRIIIGDDASDAPTGTLYINSGVTVKIATGKTWSIRNGISGSGTVVLNGATPSFNSAWTGTAVYTQTGNGLVFSGLGNANSTLRFNGVSGYPGNSGYTFAGTSEMVDNGETPALNIIAAQSTRILSLSTVTGSGTVKATHTVDSSSESQSYGVLGDVTGFSGNLSTTDDYGWIIGTVPSGTTVAGTAGKIIISENATATVASGKTWSYGSNGAVIVNGTLKVADGATINMSTVSTTIVGNHIDIDTTSEDGYTIYTSKAGGSTVYFVGTPNAAVTAFTHTDGPAFTKATEGAAYDYDYTIEAGGSLSFTVTLDDDYKLEADAASATMGTLTETDGTYTLANIQADSTVTITAALRQTAQIGTTVYTTFAKAIAAKQAGAEGDIIILDPTATIPNGWYNVEGKLVTEKGVAKIGNVYYTTLANAVAAASAGTEIVVEQAVSDTAVTIGVGTAEEPLVLSVAGNYLATPQITLADGVTVKMLCTNGGNRAFKFAGATGVTTKPTLIIDGDGSSDWGEDAGSSLGNLKLVVTNVTRFWIDNSSKLTMDTSVDVEIDAEASAVVENNTTRDIGNLSGSGSFTYHAGTINVHATGTKTTFSGTRNGTINIFGGTDAVVQSSLIRTVGATLDSTWTGTVVYKQAGSDTAIWFADFGNADSTIRFNGVAGYPGSSGFDAFEGTSEMVDDGTTPALNIVAAQSDRILNLKKVTGNGTITSTHTVDASTESQSYGVIADASEFRGSISTSSDYGWIIGTVPSGTAVTDVVGKIIVEEVAEAWIYKDKTWTADKIIMNGTLYVQRSNPQYEPTIETTLAGKEIGSEYYDDEATSTHWIKYFVASPVAQIDNGTTVTQYATIDDAVAAATEGQTVKVLSDVSVDDITAAPECNVTIDFDYHTATLAYALYVNSGDKSVVLKNGTIISTGYGVLVYSANNVTITNFAINATGSYGAISYYYGGSVTIEAGSVINVASGAALTQSEDCPITVKGGKFKGSTLLTDTSLIEARDGYTASWSEKDSEGYQTPVWTEIVTWPEGWGTLPETYKTEYLKRFNTWKSTYSVTDFTGNAEKAFMLNVAPDADVTLEVTELTIDGTTVKITTNQTLKNANVVVYVQSGSVLGSWTGLKLLAPAEDYDTTGKTINMTGQSGDAAFYKVGVDYEQPTIK